jgi:hypothetical protein
LLQVGGAEHRELADIFAPLEDVSGPGHEVDKLQVRSRLAQNAGEIPLLAEVVAGPHASHEIAGTQAVGGFVDQSVVLDNLNAVESRDIGGRDSQVPVQRLPNYSPTIWIGRASIRIGMECRGRDGGRA